MVWIDAVISGPQKRTKDADFMVEADKDRWEVKTLEALGRHQLIGIGRTSPSRRLRFIQ